MVENIGDAVGWKLYLSHFLSTWNARQFEFAAIIFTVSIFRGTLLPPSIFGLVVTVTAALSSSWLGKWIDRVNRLTAMRWSILLQRADVCAACVMFGIMLHAGSANGVLFAVIVVFGAIEKLCAIANKIAMERDWVVVICDQEAGELARVNAVMRRIDLSCALLSPLFVSFMTDLVSTSFAIQVTFAMSVLSSVLEYWTVALVYHAYPALHVKTPVASPPPPIERQSVRSTLAYWRHEVFWPSFSLCLLYFSVLQIGGQMIAYLKYRGTSDMTIAFMRGWSVVFGLGATFLAPKMIRAIGVERTGLWSLWSQLTCLLPVVLSFYAHLPVYANTAIIILFLSCSRLGLWGYDLTSQSITQTLVASDVRGMISGCEASWMNCFEALTWLSTVVWSDPQDFRIPATISLGVVAVAAVCFSGWSKKRRGHLFHLLDHVYTR